METQEEGCGGELEALGGEEPISRKAMETPDTLGGVVESDEGGEEPISRKAMETTRSLLQRHGF